MDIILASNSPRRRELLGQMGIDRFDIISPDVDERVAAGRFRVPPPVSRGD